jgi:hypothetical protein
MLKFLLNIQHYPQQPYPFEGTLGKYNQPIDIGEYKRSIKTIKGVVLREVQVIYKASSK